MNIKGCYHDPLDQEFFWIVQEYLDGGELFEKVSDAGHFGEKEAAEVMQ